MALTNPERNRTLMPSDKMNGSIFDALRGEEAQASWLEYLEGLGDPGFPVKLPPDNQTVDIPPELEVPEEDIPAVLAARPDRDRDPELWWLLERSVNSLVSTMGSVDPPPWFPSPIDIKGLNPFFFVHVFIATLPHTRRYHRAHGIPEDVAQATLADLGRNIHVHRKRYGEGGLGVSHWLMLHFRGCIYQLGRLQFERTRLRQTFVDAIVATGERVGEESLALSVHIPDFLGPMTPEACDHSYRLAGRFFPEHFPEETFKYAVCISWLLDPQLKDYLPEQSNIIRFQERFALAGPGNDADQSVLQFVFGPTPDNLDTLPQRSALERGIVSHLKQDGHWRFRPGWHRLG
jgi:hypothetical protein